MKKTDRETSNYIQLDSRFCLECGDELVYGRCDRRFCSDKCRYEYHNGIARSNKMHRSRIHAILDRNYSILESLVHQGIEEIPLLQICELGFNPNYMTISNIIRSRHECGIYDIHYRLSETKLSAIRKVSVYLPSPSREHAGKKKQGKLI